MSHRARLLLIFLFITAFLLVFQSTTIFPDPDSFYHAGMTRLIREGTLVPKDFQWLPFTILGTNYVDHHYLYHVALVPFSLIHPLFGLKLATAVIGGLFAVVFALLLLRLNVRYPELFILLLFVHGPFLFRMNLVKAPSFALVMLFGVLFALVSRKRLLSLALSFVYVWAYDGWVIGLLVAGVFWVIRAFGVMAYQRNTVSLKTFLRELFSSESMKLIGSVTFGMAAGVVINPYFPSNLGFYYDHIVRIGFIGYRQVIGVGGEWYGYPLVELLGASAIAIAFFVLASVVFVVRLKRQDEWTLTSLFLALLFAIATVRSQRYVEYFIPFLVMYVALAFRQLDWDVVREWVRARIHSKRWIAAAYALLFVAAFAVTKDVLLVHTHLSNGFQLSFLRNESAWIGAHLPRGEVVFHSNWDEFPALFFYNRNNRYVAGLDPAFLYARDKKRFFLWRDITQGKLTKNIAMILRTEFDSRYALASKNHKDMRANLESKGFIQLYEGPNAAIYKAP